MILERTVTLLLLLFMISFSGNAQTLKAYERAGDKAMDDQEFFAASQYYKEAIKINKGKLNVHYKYAHACRSFNAFKEADKAYKYVEYGKDTKKYPLLFFWQATVKKQLGEYEKAGKLFNKYLTTDQDPTSYYHLKAKQEVLACAKAPSIIKDAIDIKVNWLGDKVNTPYSEFAPHQVGDSLYYSSMSFKITEKKTGKTRYFAKLLLSENKEKGKRQKGFGDKEEHAANSTTSPDGSRLYFTKCQGENSSDINCTIFVRKKKDNTWLPPEELGATVNFDGYTSTHPNIGYDSIRQQEILFFSSNRPGGQGKMDVWYSLITPAGDYGDAVNLGKAINTIDDEITPFFHTASQSLYFSSNWHEGLGGYDVFNSKYRQKSWNTPINVGYPLNSSYNDVYYTINEDNYNGFLSSNREGSLSLTKEEACCNDIYGVQIPKQNPPEPPIVKEAPPTKDPVVVVPPKPLPPPVTVVPDIVDKPTPAPPIITTETTFQELERMLPVTLYFHNDEPDSNTVARTTRQNYERHYLWYYSMKEEYITKYSKGVLDDSYQVNDFFEYKVRQGYDDLYIFSEKLLKVLMEGYKVKVSVKGFTSPRAPTSYNYALAHRRIMSAKNFFNEFRDGVFKQFVQSGRFQFVDTPFGETTAPAGISDVYSDRRNSIYSVEASQERRIEIMRIEKY